MITHVYVTEEPSLLLPMYIYVGAIIILLFYVIIPGNSCWRYFGPYNRVLGRSKVSCTSLDGIRKGLSSRMHKFRDLQSFEISK